MLKYIRQDIGYSKMKQNVQKITKKTLGTSGFKKGVTWSKNFSCTKTLNRIHI